MRDACDVGRDGCSAADIVRAARQYGLEATGWKQEPEDLPGLSLPAILFWEFRHFVVLEGVGKGQYFLNDPGRGRYSVDEVGFDRRLHRRGPGVEAGVNRSAAPRRRRGCCAGCGPG